MTTTDEEVDRGGVSTPLRVAILNDFEVVVEGLSAMLAQFPERVQVQDVSTAAVEGQRVDVVLFDTFAADEASVHWSHYVAPGWEPRHVVHYGWVLDEHATGSPGSVIPKNLESAALVDALEQVVSTGAYLPHGEVSQGPTDSDEEAASTVRTWPGKTEGLTERQSEVLVLIVAGLSNSDIADRLYLSVNTIKAYIRSAYTKMGVTSRSTAVLWGIDHGFRRGRSE